MDIELEETNLYKNLQLNKDKICHINLNNFSIKDLIIIQKLLQINTSIQKIEFIHSIFDSRKMKYIIKGIKKNTNIQTISIIYSDISGKEIKYLLNELKKTKYINILSIYWVNYYQEKEFQNNFIKYLGEGILFNKYLKEIYLQDCQINSNSIKYINDICKFNKNVKIHYNKKETIIIVEH